MAEYIDRQVLLDEIKKLHDKHGVEDGEEMLFSEGDIRGLLLCAPAADVATVRHGRWFELTESIHDTHTDEYYDEVYYNCNLCDYAADIKTPWCPNCGARMDLGGTENA